jgi:hypothetical protein
MKRALSWLLALCMSACVEGRVAERGEPSDTWILDENTNKTSRELVVEDQKAFFTYEETHCTKLKFTYLQNVYEKSAFPTGAVSPIALGLAATGLLFGLTSQDPGFFWPESVPAITPIGFGTAVVFGVGGFIPIAFGLGKPQYKLLSTRESDDYDRVETNCSTSKRNVTEKLPWRARLHGDVVTGTTGSDGVFDVDKVARTVLVKGQKLDPAHLEFFAENPELFLKFELAGHQEKLQRVDLYEVPIYEKSLRLHCSEECIDAGEARQCRRREAICREESSEIELCWNMRASCLERESPNMAGYDACFDRCVKKRLTEIFEKK